MTDDIRIVVDDAQTQEALRTVRRDLDRQMRLALRQVSDRAVPLARSAVHGRELADHLRGGSTSRSAWVQADGKRFNAWLGLVEYGGGRNDIIRPVHAKALKLPWGFAASVPATGGTEKGRESRYSGLNRTHRRSGWALVATSSKEREYERTLHVTHAFQHREPEFAHDIETTLKPLLARIGTVA